MTLSSTELSVLVEFLPLLRFPCFVSCLSFLAKDCQGKELRLVTLVNTSRELGSLVTGLHTVLAAVTWSRPQWCSARSVWGLLLLPAPLLPASVAPVRALWFLLPSNNITWVKKKKNHRNTVSQRLLWSVLPSGRVDREEAILRSLKSLKTTIISLQGRSRSCWVHGFCSLKCHI